MCILRAFCLELCCDEFQMAEFASLPVRWKHTSGEVSVVKRVIRERSKHQGSTGLHIR